VEAEMAQFPVPADLPAVPVRSAELVCPALAAAEPEVEPAFADAEPELEVDFVLSELEPALALAPAHDASTSEPE